MVELATTNAITPTLSHHVHILLLFFYYSSWFKGSSNLVCRIQLLFVFIFLWPIWAKATKFSFYRQKQWLKHLQHSHSTFNRNIHYLFLFQFCVYWFFSNGFSFSEIYHLLFYSFNEKFAPKKIRYSIFRKKSENEIFVLKKDNGWIWSTFCSTP